MIDRGADVALLASVVDAYRDWSLAVLIVDNIDSPGQKVVLEFRAPDDPTVKHAIWLQADRVEHGLNATQRGLV